MDTRTIRPEEEIALPGDASTNRTALMEQLERILESRHFRNSKRYPAFLRYVVEHTLTGSADTLKERTIGVDVFARPSDYDTNADPIVRVTAGEVRKRIAQYYQEAGHEQEVRIELPLGGYVPLFLNGGEPPPLVEIPVPGERTIVEAPAAAEEATLLSPELEVVVVEPPVVQGPTGRRRLRLLIAFLATFVILCGVLAGWRSWRTHHEEVGIGLVWQPVVGSSRPVLNVIGVHTLDRQGNEMLPASHAGGAGEPGDMLTAMVRSDMVPVSDIVSDSRITDLLTRRSRSYTTVGSADATLDQLRAGPVVLLGGLDNIWTLRLTAKLRYRFFAQAQSESSIVDRDHPETRWSFDNLQKPVGSTEDYAIVASYFDDTIDQPVIVIAGIGKAGTLVASEFMTSDQALRTWARQEHYPGSRNVEMVLATQILDGEAGPPRVIATEIW